MRKTCRGILFLLVAALCALNLTACSQFSLNLINKLTLEDSELVKEESNEIIRCLTEKDRDSFCALFSDEARQSETFEQEVDALFDFFKCDVYIKAGIEELAGGGGSMESGSRTDWYLRPEITYIQVLVPSESGADEMDYRYYGVHYYWQVKDDAYPKNVGLHYLEVDLLNTDESASVGAEE